MSVSFLNPKSSHGLFTFEIKSDPKQPLDKSIVNGLRRVILDELPAVGIPQEQIHIEINDTSLHNEFMKHRLSLLPLHCDPFEFKDDYLFELDVSNQSDQVRVVTTRDIQAYPLKDSLVNTDISFKESNYDRDKPLSRNQLDKLWKPFEIEGIQSYILITELKPQSSPDDFQRLKVWFHAKVGTGSENAMYNNISQCSYSFKEDDKLLKQALQNELEIKQVTKSTEKKQVEREFTNAYRQRYYHRTLQNEPYWYLFSIKSNGYFKSKRAFQVSFQILLNRLTDSIDQFKSLNSEPESSRYEVEVGENRSLYFTMKGENDTLGNLLQSHIVNQITKESLITFCGYRKVHPLEETIQLVVHHNLLDEVDHSSIVTRVIFSLIESMETLQQLIESLSQKSETM